MRLNYTNSQTNVIAAYLYVQMYRVYGDDALADDTEAYHAHTDCFISAMNAITERLRDESKMDDAEIQAIVFEEARANFEKYQDFFTIFYTVMFQKDRGPKLGQLIKILGWREVLYKIDQNMAFYNLVKI